MRSTEQAERPSANLTEIGEHWLKTKVELLRISTIENVSGLAGSLMFMFLLVLFCLISFGFITVALALVIAEYMNSTVVGFGAVGLLYIIIAITLAFVGRDYVRERVMDWLIKEISENEE